MSCQQGHRGVPQTACERCLESANTRLKEWEDQDIHEAMDCHKSNEDFDRLRAELEKTQCEKFQYRSERDLAVQGRDQATRALDRLEEKP